MTAGAAIFPAAAMAAFVGFTGLPARREPRTRSLCAK